MGRKDRIERSVNCQAGVVCCKKTPEHWWTSYEREHWPDSPAGTAELALCRNYGLQWRERRAGRDESEQGRMGQCSSRQQMLRAVVGTLFGAVIVRWRCTDAESCWEGRNLHLKVATCRILKTDESSARLTNYHYFKVTLINHKSS